VNTIQDAPEQFYDTAVVVTAGKLKGRVFNFDDYAGRTAYLYNPNIVMAAFRRTFEVPLRYIRSATFDDLWNRRDQLLNEWIRNYSKSDDTNSVEMLLELYLIEQSLFDQIHTAEMTARFKPASNIFLSYSSQDEWFARRLFLELSKHNIQPWMYLWQVRPGDIIPLEISRALESSSIYLVLLSEASLKSLWVQEEWTTALHETVTAGKRIIVLRLDDADVPGILRKRAWVDFRGGFDEALLNLMRGLATDDEGT
jgi:hypothetical protein